MQIIVDDLLTHYESTGSGSSLLLLHGWGDTAATFDMLVPALAESHTVIRLDLPGFGNTQAPKTVWGLEEYARFVGDFLTKLTIKDLSAVIAHSNGGAVAIRGLADGTISARRLILLAASGIRDKQKGRRLFIKGIAKTGKAATFWLPARHKRVLQQKLYGAAGSDMLVAPHLQETFKKTVRQDVQADAAKLKLPTLLVYGAADRATPPAYGQLFQELIPGSRLEVLQGAEHFVHHDRPDEILRLAKEFLR